VAANDRGWLDAVALRDLVADGEVTPAEVAEGAIVRIEKPNTFSATKHAGQRVSTLGPSAVRPQ
jgi:hypothetical protein